MSLVLSRAAHQPFSKQLPGDSKALPAQRFLTNTAARRESTSIMRRAV
jgi:hypothetical protein